MAGRPRRVEAVFCSRSLSPAQRYAVSDEEEEEVEEEEEDASEYSGEGEARGGGRRGGQAARGRKPLPLPAEEEEEDEVVVADAEGAAVAQVLGPTGEGEGSDAVFACLLVGRSYRDLALRSRTWLQIHAPAKLRGLRQRSEAAGGPLFPPSFTAAERVVASRPAPAGEQLLVKWTGLGYAASTWEEASSWQRSAADAECERRFRLRQRAAAASPPPPPSAAAAAARLPPDGSPVQPPPFAPGCALRDYQRVSFDWMVRNALARRSVILGDEMGLGKTAQSVAVLEWLRLHAPPALRRPFLIVAPLTTLVHWQREVEKWTPMNAVIYGGSAEDKRACVHHEFYARGAPRRAPSRDQLLFDCLLISYETLRRDAGLLGGLPWGAAVADEAHRLKDFGSATATVLRQSYRLGWLLLLTGTPVQNNLSEIFGLLHLLDRPCFPSLEDFQERFCPGGVVEASRMPALAAALRPYLLRRMKEDVETIPEKEEVVVWVEMTADQRAYYKALHEQKMHVLLAANSRKNMPSSRNLLMELRHCCNHPFLLTGIADDYAAKRAEAAAAAAPPQPPPSYAEMLVSASGKMLLLSKLLPKLRAEGHKVLIFSQFKLVLDLLQDMCADAGWPAERLDGDTSAAERQAGIDRFNDAAAGGFVYLLSTRAGGMGITLTAADVAVIFDSDWNPQADLQAMARCHRIGQTKAVRVYRLVTRGTCEEAILASANRKYGLDEALLGGSAGGAGGEEEQLADVARIEGLLKHGVMAFSAAAEAESSRFVAEGIDDILSTRAERRQVGSRKGNTFSTATFVVDEAASPSADEPPAAEPAQQQPQLSGAEYWAAHLPDAVAREMADPHALRALLVEGAGGGRLRERRKPSGAYALADGGEESEGQRAKRTKRKGQPNDGWGLAPDPGAPAGDWEALERAAEQRRARKRETKEKKGGRGEGAAVQRAQLQSAAAAAAAAERERRAAPRRSAAAAAALAAAAPAAMQILEQLELPASLLPLVVELGSYLVQEEPPEGGQSQFAQPTLLALAIIAADTAAYELGCRRSPALLGATFGLAPHAVEAYCAEVYRLIRARIAAPPPRGVDARAEAVGALRSALEGRAGAGAEPLVQ